MDYCVVSIAGHCGAEGTGTRTVEDCFETEKEAQLFQENLFLLGQEDPCPKCGAGHHGWLGQIYVLPESELNEFLEGN